MEFTKTFAKEKEKILGTSKVCFYNTVEEKILQKNLSK